MPCASPYTLWLPRRRGAMTFCWNRGATMCYLPFQNTDPWGRGWWRTPGFPRRASLRSVSTRPYCGQVGKQENCRVAVSLSLATWSSSLPVEYRLYLPTEGAEDSERREKTEVPEEVEFQTQPGIAL